MLGVAFEVLQLGLTPERAKKMLALSDATLRGVAAEVGKDLVANHWSTDRDSALYVVFDPVALSVLHDPVDDYRNTDLLRSGYGRQLADENWRTRFAIINMTTLLQRTAVYLSNAGHISSEKFGEAVVAWASDGKHA